MAKQNFEEQRFKLSEKIKKSENTISVQREKIKNWQAEIKALESEENKKYTDEFLAIISENGLSDKTEKSELLIQIANLARQKAEAKKAKPPIQKNDISEKITDIRENEVSIE